jgi:hypothetical protein
MNYYKDITYYLELTLIDSKGDFVTGQTVTYNVYKSSDESLFDSGTLSEIGTSGVYKASIVFTEARQYRVEYTTPTKYENAIEEILVIENTDESLEEIKNRIGTPTSGETVISDLNDIKDETDKIQPDIIDVPDDYKADVSALATEANATSNKNEIITEVDENETKIDSIITTLSSLVSNVWSYGTRTLTSFGSLVSDIWTYITRTLTAGTKDTEIDDIKTKTDKMNFTGIDIKATLDNEEVDIGKVKGVGVSGIDDFKNEMTESELHSGLDSYANKDDYKADLSILPSKEDIAGQVWDESIADHLGGDKAGQHLEDADATADPEAVAQAVWDELVAGAGSSSFRDMMKRIAGLCQENYRIFNPTYIIKNNQSCMTSATIKIYSTSADVDADTNAIAEYTVTATFDNSARMINYKVKKV